MKPLAFAQATRRYEKWLAAHVDIVERDLHHKYVKMRKDVFTFFRGTFYRWVELWETQRRELRRGGVLLPKAPDIFCIGDLHLENFGTWRDAEGRLIWGVNDFDEAYPMKYMTDLVRLGTSAWFALQNRKTGWTLSFQDVCAELLNGYADNLSSGGRCFELGQEITWLWKIATHPSRTPEEFWTELAQATREAPGKRLRKVAKEAAEVLRHWVPAARGVQPHSLRLRQAGVGSLGRPRFIQLYDGRSGRFLREAKAVVPSAAVFAGLGKPIGDAYQRVLRRAIRVPDPFYAVTDGWVIRRLAFDSNKVELESLDTIHDARSFFRAMGAETANIHLGAKDPAALSRHLAAQGEARPDWLAETCTIMAKVTQRDFEEFRSTKLGLDR